MKELTAEERLFLHKHKIPVSSVMDARKMMSHSYGITLHIVGKQIAVVGYRCKRGHRLRTASGNCPQCNTANLAFQRRQSTRGYVYIAGSRAAEFVKVGSTTDITKRENELRDQAYASRTDWLMLLHVRCDRSGHIETELHKLLEKHRVAAQHFKEGQMRDCREVFDCSFHIAKFNLSRLLNSEQMARAWENPAADKFYRFLKQAR